jgi:hypothetical protein
LAVFAEGANDEQSTDLPAYDHDQLGPVFASYFTRLTRLLRVPEPPSVIEVRFQDAGDRLSASLDKLWFQDPNWNVYFGLNLKFIPVEEREHFAKRCFFDRNILPWSLEPSDGRQEFDFSKSLKLINLDVAKPHLYRRPAWLFAEIRPDHNWDEVKRRHEISFRLDDRHLGSFSADTGDMDMVSVKVGGQSYTFQVAVFAVKE